MMLNYFISISLMMPNISLMVPKTIPTLSLRYDVQTVELECIVVANDFCSHGKTICSLQTRFTFVDPPASVISHEVAFHVSVMHYLLKLITTQQTTSIASVSLKCLYAY